MGQPNLRAMSCHRAIDFVIAHTLRNLDEQGRRDWIQEMELVVDYDVEFLEMMVKTKAAVDVADAADQMFTMRLQALQPHRAAALQAALTKRRTPRVTAATASKPSVISAG